MENSKVKNFFRFNSMICKSKILRFLFFLMILMPLNQVTIYEIQANNANEAADKAERRRKFRTVYNTYYEDLKSRMHNSNRRGIGELGTNNSNHPGPGSAEEERNRMARKIQELLDLHRTTFNHWKAMVPQLVIDVVKASHNYKLISQKVNRLRNLKRSRQSITEEEANNFRSALKELDTLVPPLYRYHKLSQDLTKDKKKLNTELQTLEKIRKAYIDDNSRITNLGLESVKKGQNLKHTMRIIAMKIKALHFSINRIDKSASKIKEIAKEFRKPRAAAPPLKSELESHL